MKRLSLLKEMLDPLKTFMEIPTPGYGTMCPAHNTEEHALTDHLIESAAVNTRRVLTEKGLFPIPTAETCGHSVATLFSLLECVERTYSRHAWELGFLLAWNEHDTCTCGDGDPMREMMQLVRWAIHRRPFITLSQEQKDHIESHGKRSGLVLF